MSQVHYHIALVTGQMAGSGTDSNIDVQLFGTLRRTERFRLNRWLPGDAFESGQTDSLTVLCDDLGEVKRVKLWSDDRYSGSDWLLAEVRIECKEKKQQWKFPCYKWFKGQSLQYDLDCVIPSRGPGREIYNIAHMCNTPSDVDWALGEGANAIECDVQCKRQGDIYTFTVHHGYRFGSAAIEKRSRGSTDLLPFLAHLQRKHPAMVVFDCKEPPGDVTAYNYGRILCSQIKRYLPASHCVISIPTISMTDVFKGKNHESFAAWTDISMMDIDPGGKDPHYWIDTANQQKITWLGLGIDSYHPLAPLYNWIDPLAVACVKRDLGMTSVNKVYYWTLDAKESMRRVLRTGVDGIIVNDPKTLNEVLGENEFKSLSLAT